MPDIPLPEQIAGIRGLIGRLEMEIEGNKSSGFYTPRIRTDRALLCAVLATLETIQTHMDAAALL